jgi:predicted enzyme related to lactoylglutathione lyase
MTDITGKFCWHDLVTTDKTKSQKFYEDALGWKAKEMKEKDFTYHMISHSSGKDVGIYTEEKDGPNQWLGYISVTDIDATAKAVTEKGGKLIKPVMDAGDHGRMAVCCDPYGATFALWQAKKKEPPAETKQKKGGKKTKELAYDDIFTWHEVMVPEGKTGEGAAFYSSVLGWKITESKQPDGSAYIMFSVGDSKPHAGLMQQPKDGCLSWTSYIGSDDVEATLKAVQGAGGRVVKEAADVSGYGRFGVFVDTVGAHLAIFQPSAETTGKGSKRKPAKKPASQPKKKRAKKNDDDDDYAPEDDLSD